MSLAAGVLFGVGCPPMINASSRLYAVCGVIIVDGVRSDLLRYRSGLHGIAPCRYCDTLQAVEQYTASVRNPIITASHRGQIIGGGWSVSIVRTECHPLILACHYLFQVRPRRQTRRQAFHLSPRRTSTLRIDHQSLAPLLSFDSRPRGWYSDGVPEWISTAGFPSCAESRI